MASRRGSRLASSLCSPYVAFVQEDCIVLLDRDRLEPHAELGTEGRASTEVGFVDDGTRVIVVDRVGDDTKLHLVDPTGPTKLGELVTRGGGRLLAIAGQSVLLGDSAPVLVDTTVTLRPQVLPLRAPVLASARMSDTSFLIAFSSSIEEWDGRTCAPRRRMRIERPIDPLFIGGTGQRVWSVPRDVPRFIDVIALSQRTTRRIDLPDEIVRVVPHPTRELLAIVGTNGTYLFDLAHTRTVTRIDADPIEDLVWIEDTRLLVSIGHDLRVLAVPAAGGRLADPATSRSRSLFTTVPPVEPPDDDAPVVALLSEHNTMLSPASPELPREHGWRGDLVAWARGARRTIPEQTLIDELAERLGLQDERLALALLYAAHLLGQRGVAPVELATVLGWRWDDALGTGRLAALDVVSRRDDRWRLREELSAFLDEREPVRGALVSGPGTTTSIVAVVAPERYTLHDVAIASASRIGTLFVPTPRGQRSFDRFLLEGRARGLFPLVPDSEYVQREHRLELAAVVVREHARANALKLPVVATVE